jgi:replicative DNA helicase
MNQTSNQATSCFDRRHAVGEVIEDFRKVISNEKTQQTTVCTGFEWLDFYLDGLKPGLHVLAGRAQMGKTTLMLNITDHICFEQKVPSLIFSMELRAHDLLRRMILSKAHLDPLYHERKPNQVLKGELIRLRETADKIAASRLFIEENISFWIDDLINTAKRHKAENHIGFIAIDHLQLLRSNTSSTAHDAEIIDIVSKLKRLSLEVNVPILLVTGLMREPPQSKKHFFGLPLAHHIKHYQSINGYLDSVTTLYLPRYYATHEAERTALYTQAKLTVYRVSKGDSFPINLHFDDHFMRFFEDDDYQNEN